MKFISRTTEETKDVARNLLDSIQYKDKAVVVALSGELGAGKTDFTQIVGAMVGVRENMHSPTFVIMKVYEIDWEGFKNLIHIDAYRLEKDSELLHLGWEKILSEPENLVLIEWPENVSGIIPSGAKKVSFTVIDENTREIEIHES